MIEAISLRDCRRSLGSGSFLCQAIITFEVLLHPTNQFWSSISKLQHTSEIDIVRVTTIIVSDFDVLNLLSSGTIIESIIRWFLIVAVKWRCIWFSFNRWLFLDAFAR